MEDARILLLLHTLSGLLLSSDELEAILARPGLSARELASLVASPEGLAYLEAHRDWVDRSRAIVDRSRERGVRWVLRGESEYPRLWYELSVAPPIFSYLGTACWLERDLLAVVGSRTPMVETRYWMQRELGQFLKMSPIGIVSGGARGVDQWAHRLCIDYGNPTVCVLPTGILNPYPFGQERLWKSILEGGGCLLSTFALEEPLRKWAFHVRNRWIAGLARVCFVAEANRRSGSTLTATLAVSEGREVCTLPVFPLNDQGLANLDLLGAGAHLIRDHRDLAQLCLRPAALERPNREEQEEGVH